MQKGHTMNELIILGIALTVLLTVILIDQIGEIFAFLMRFCRCVIEVIAERIFKAQTAYYRRRQRRKQRKGIANKF